MCLVLFLYYKYTNRNRIFMKKIFILILILESCSMAEIIDMPIPRTKADTIYIPRQVDSTQTSDVPVEFYVSVDDWVEE